MSKRLERDIGYIWDTCQILLSKEYSGTFDERTRKLIVSISKIAQELMIIMATQYD